MSIPIGQYVALLAQYLKPQALRVVLLAVLLLTGLGLQLANPLDRAALSFDAAASGAALEQLLSGRGPFLGIALLTRILSLPPPTSVKTWAGPPQRPAREPRPPTASNWICPFTRRTRPAR